MELQGSYAIVDFSGIHCKISIDWIEDACIGDKLLIHAGCAIAKLSEQAYAETVSALSMLEEADHE